MNLKDLEYQNNFENEKEKDLSLSSTHYKVIVVYLTN